MKILSTLIVLASLGLIVGCNRSDADRAATDVRETTEAVSRSAAETATNLTPTSRNIDGTSRTYQSDTEKAANAEPDNTAKNVRDRSETALTPGDQGNSESDREITRKIRRALTQNDQLSTVAKNIKIITVNGKVTLRGPVKSQEEQQAIATAAQAVSGISALDNQLEVKTQ